MGASWVPLLRKGGRAKTYPLAFWVKERRSRRRRRRSLFSLSPRALGNHFFPPQD